MPVDALSPAAKGGGCNPKTSDLVYPLLIIHRLGVCNDIWGGVELSPLINFKYSRWLHDRCSKGLTLGNSYYFNVFCHRSVVFLAYIQ